MNTMRKTLTLSLVAAAAVTTVYAGSGYTPSDYHHAGMAHKAHANTQRMHLGSDIHHLDVLDLTEAQREQIDTITAEFNDEMARLQSKRQQAASELPELYAADVPDAAAIGDAYGELFEAKRERIEVMIDTRNRVLEVLTDEQREELGRFNYGTAVDTGERVQS